MNLFIGPSLLLLFVLAEMLLMAFLKMAQKELPPFLNDFFNPLSLSILDIPHIIPHQASKTGLFMFEKMLQFKKGVVKSNLETHGNCISASIPIILHTSIENGTIKRGDNCFLIGTSAGFSLAGLLFKY